MNSFLLNNNNKLKRQTTNLYCGGGVKLGGGRLEGTLKNLGGGATSEIKELAANNIKLHQMPQKQKKQQQQQPTTTTTITSSTAASKIMTNENLIKKILSSKIDDPPLVLVCEPTNNTNFNFDLSADIDENTPPTSLLSSTKYFEKDFIKTFQNSDLLMYSTPIEKLPSNVILENNNIRRIKRDLNSPSANARMRAIKALRSPKNNNYNNFDIPHEEQSIITVEEKQAPKSKTPKLEDLFKEIVVYVEVRTEDHNRSAGIKQVIKKMGAKINEKLYRDTTHVVFKDGLISTYNKAKSWHIPIVSILWVEACKRNLRILDPIKYQISNIERYENPDLFEKIPRAKRTTNPDSNKKTKMKDIKHNNIEGTKLKSNIRIPRKPKDNLNEILAEFHEKLLATPDGNDLPFQSKLLERIKNSPLVNGSKLNNNNNNLNFPNSTVQNIDESIDLTPKNSKTDDSTLTAKKILEFDSPQTSTAVKSPELITSNNLITVSDVNAESSQLIATVAVDKINDKTDLLIQKSFYSTRSNRKTKIFNFKELLENKTPAQKKKSNSEKNNNITLDLEISQSQPTQTSIPRKMRRRTVYSFLPMEISKSNNVGIEKNDKHSEQALITDASKKLNNNARKTKKITPTKKLNESEELTKVLSEDNDVVNDSKKSNKKNGNAVEFNKVETPSQNKINHLTKNGLFQETARSIAFSSTKEPKRRRTVFDMSMDIIDQSLQKINKTATKLMNKEIDKNSNLAPTSDQDSNDLNSTPIIKKRRLFAPSHLLFSPPVVESSQTNELNSNEKSSSSFKLPLKKDAKKSMRKTIGVPSISVPKVKKRRSSADFEISKKEVITKAISRKLHEKNKKVIVYTNMHTEQICYIRKARDVLDFDLVDSVNEKTTHVISLEPRRTINLLKALIRGIWILNYDWIVESVKCGKWLNEEEYEMRSFSRAVEICRSERQTFGSSYKMDIFTDLTAIYVSKDCCVPRNNIIELIRLCSGKITDQKEDAEIIVGENSNGNKKLCLKPQWILDSISENKLQKYSKYLIRN